MSQLGVGQNRASSHALQRDVVQAGFLRRWVALTLDQIILSTLFYTLFFAALMILGFTVGFETLDSLESDQSPTWAIAIGFVMWALYLICDGLYFALMESSRHQATIGKIALGIKVVDQYGHRLSFTHALARWFAAALSYLTLYIGFLMAAFTQKKQALHDLVAATMVVDKWAYTEFPERQTRRLSGCLVVFAVLMGLMLALAVVGMIAAIAIPAYQQTTAQTQFAQLEAPLARLTTQVESYFESNGQCPDNAADGFGAPNSYADALISRVVVGEFEPGYCGVSVWMPPLQGSVERQFLAEFDPHDAAWYCIDKAGFLNLPDWCH